jgi:DNA-binding MarR family transcriptional regulator
MLHLFRERSHEAPSGIMLVLREGGVSTAQAFALLFLAEDGPRHVSAVAAHLGLSMPAVSHLVERLVQAGFLRRWEDHEDRRLRRVELTSDGRSLVEKIEDARTREFDEAFEGLSPAVRRKLQEAVDAVLAELRR